MDCKEEKRERGKEGKRERGKEGKRERGKGKKGKRERGKEGKREKRNMEKKLCRPTQRRSTQRRPTQRRPTQTVSQTVREVNIRNLFQGCSVGQCKRHGADSFIVFVYCCFTLMYDCDVSLMV